MLTLIGTFNGLIVAADVDRDGRLVTNRPPIPAPTGDYEPGPFPISPIGRHGRDHGPIDLRRFTEQYRVAVAAAGVTGA